MFKWIYLTLLMVKKGGKQTIQFLEGKGSKNEWMNAWMNELLNI